MNFRNLPVRKYISGFDTFIRHRLVAELTDQFSPATILDVGGEGALRFFVPEVEITTANIKEADICYTGGRLPLSDGSFDLVVSLDTVEHLPRERRREFMTDLFRVSRKGIIVCAPLGTPEHSAYEKKVLDSGMLSGPSRDYLSQHASFGLPTAAEVSQIAALFKASIHYQGDFREIKPGRSRSEISAYLSLICQAVNNMLINSLWDPKKHLKDSFCPYTNRFFLVARKNVYGS